MTVKTAESSKFSRVIRAIGIFLGFLGFGTLTEWYATYSHLFHWLTVAIACSGVIYFLVRFRMRVAVVLRAVASVFDGSWLDDVPRIDDGPPTRGRCLLYCLTTGGRSVEKFFGIAWDRNGEIIVNVKLLCPACDEVLLIGPDLRNANFTYLNCNRCEYYVTVSMFDDDLRRFILQNAYRHR